MYTKPLCNSVIKHILQAFIFHQKSDLRFLVEDFFMPGHFTIFSSSCQGQGSISVASPAAMSV